MSRTGAWDRHVLPRLTDQLMSRESVAFWRAPVCAGASGVVLDIGFGSGPNLPYYPDAVTRVLAADPSDLAWELAADRVAAFGRPVERVAVDAADLGALADGSVDTVVSAWSLCTVPDVDGALREARRVLAPGGTFHLVEHGRSPSRRTARMQDLVQPLWGRVAGGCHVDRDIRAALRRAGFSVESVRGRAVAPAPMAPWTWFVTGTAFPAEA